MIDFEKDKDIKQSDVKNNIPSGATCDHSQMTECHVGCGHFSCPCGITWDEGFEGNAV